MSRFRYRAVSASGEVRDDVIEAASEQAAVDALRANGLRPIRLAVGGPGLRIGLLRAARYLAPGDVAIVSRQIATLLEAGLPLERALQITTELLGGASAQAFGQVLEHVRGGKSLADALTAQGGFSRFYISLVRAGEASGTLDQVLLRLAEHQERAIALQDEIQSALIYPMIVVLLAVASVALMFTVVVPQFRPIFENAGDRLPLAPRIVLSISNAAENHGAVVGLVLLLAVAALRFALADPRIRDRVDAFVLRLPVVGALVVMAEMARFARALGILLKNGVTTVAAMTIAREAVSNAAFAQIVGAIAASLRIGHGLWQPMQAAGMFPPIALHLVRVGEETGRLDDMLIKIAAILDSDIQRAVKRLMAVLVPALTIILGIVVAATVGSVLTAILSVYDLAT
jgi:general secretion pathway protein F